MAETVDSLTTKAAGPRRLGWAWLSAGFILAAGWGALFSYSVIYLSGDLPLKEPAGLETQPPVTVDALSVPEPADLAKVVAAAPPRTAPPPPLVPVPGPQHTPAQPTAEAPPDSREAAPATAQATADAHPEPQVEQDFVGVWGPNRLACGLRAQRRGFIQAVITPERAKAGSTTCSFRNVRRNGIAWVMAADCAAGGQKWSSQVRLVVDGERLIWSSAKGTAEYVRCNRRTG